MSTSLDQNQPSTVSLILHDVLMRIIVWSSTPAALVGMIFLLAGLTIPGVLITLGALLMYAGGAVNLARTTRAYLSDWPAFAVHIILSLSVIVPAAMGSYSLLSQGNLLFGAVSSLFTLALLQKLIMVKDDN